MMSILKLNNRVERNEGQKLLAYSDGYDGGCYTVTYVVVASRRTRTGTPRTDPGQPDDPDCWGEVSSTVAQRDDDQPGLGEHASDPIPDGEGDHDTPRAGVGNQAEDAPPEHGANVGQIVGGCQPDRNDP